MNHQNVFTEAKSSGFDQRTALTGTPACTVISLEFRLGLASSTPPALRQKMQMPTHMNRFRYTDGFRSGALNILVETKKMAARYCLPYDAAHHKS
jgi:hypothetical protein